MAKTEVVAAYDFTEDAMGFGDFITSTMASLPDDEIVVDVQDEESRAASSAEFVRNTFADGTTTVNLIIRFDHSYD